MHEYCGENLGNEPKLVCRTTANPNSQTGTEQLPEKYVFSGYPTEQLRSLMTLDRFQ